MIGTRSAVQVTFAAPMPFTLCKYTLTQHCRQALFACCLMVATGISMAQDPGAYLAEGDSLLRMEKPQRALEAYEKAHQLAATAQTYLGRARAYYALNRSDRFLIDVEQALRLDSTLAEAHYLRSLYALRAQDMNNAAHHSSMAIEYSDNEQVIARSHIIRGLGRAEMKLPDMAITDLELGLNAGVEDIEAMRTLARLYDNVGRYEEALLILERLTQLEPGDVGHWSNRAFELIQLERHSEALTMIAEALAIDKDEPVALSNRAYIFYHMGKDKEAMQDVERSLRSYPANAYALRTRALLRLRMGEREKACEDLTLAKVLGNIPEVDALVKEHCASTPAR